eukprot:scaffold87596_cov19-Tisochrysis_lutea.AAC.1
MDNDLVFFRFPDAIGRWLDAEKKRGMQAVLGLKTWTFGGACMLKLCCLVDWSSCKAYETMATLSCAYNELLLCYLSHPEMDHTVLYALSRP